MKVVSFSFGQTSGFMLRKLMDAHPKTFEKDFRVVFCNTGKEHETTLAFGHEVEVRWGVPITWLEYTRVPATSIALNATWQLLLNKYEDVACSCMTGGFEDKEEDAA